MKLKRIGASILALVLAFGLALPAQAAKTAPALFLEGLGSNEKHCEVRRVEDDDDYEEMIEVPVIRRQASASISLTKDATIIEELQVVIPKKYTLTIEKGATLTIYGDLVIQGNLVNNGTIIVGAKSLLAEVRNSDQEMKDILSLMTLRNLDIKGKFTNNGKLNILNGSVAVGAGGTMTNAGTITITNSGNKTTALKNIATKKAGTTTYGTITNTGTIYVRNTAGTGIHNYNAAKFNNEGKIYVAHKAKVQGKISGEQPQKDTPKK